MTNNLPSQIKIGSWNTGGLRTNQNTMGVILEEDYDIFALQETKLPGDTHRFTWPGYNVYRDDINGRSGGTAILAKKELCQHRINSPDGLLSMEATIVVIITSYGDIRMISAYVRPETTIHEEDVLAVLPDGKKGIIIGDLNAKSPAWYSSRRNRQGRNLEKIIEDHPSYQAIGPVRPTHYPPNGGRPEVIDIAVLRDMTMPVEIRTIDGGDAHSPIVVTIGSGNRQAGRTVRKTNWEKFRRLTGQLLGPITEIRNKEKLEEQVCFSEEALSEAIERSTTMTIADKYGRFKNISDDLRNLIRKKNRIARRAQETRTPEERKGREMKQEIQEKLQEHRSEEWNRRIKELDPQKPVLWNISKVLREERKPMPPIHGSNGMAYTDKEKAEELKNTMELQFTLNEHPDEDMDFSDMIEENINEYLEDEEDQETLGFATPMEVKELLKFASARKTPVIDGISNRALKNMPKNVWHTFRT
ncbi:uncharacterized protein LOC130901639 [Diorhabda carinulata]|uniref:uncharacterized protein LOC130901639 n=1 Tax=Diorhabda carinulata TaxID=1163345 RepID=UPI0025A103DF|nr:uncharacterized protein LOC130901639 [Diorhabda carinulata]